MHHGNNLFEWISAGAAWAWHTSLIVLPIMALLLLLGRWRSFPASWRLILAAVVAVRLLLPMVPGVAWHPWQSGKWKVESANAEMASVSSGDALALKPEPSQEQTQMIGVAEAIPWQAVFAVVWLSGVILTSAWALGSHLRLRSLIYRNSRPADDVVRSTLTWSRQRMGLRQSLPILQITGLPTMAIWGWLSPRLLVPHDAAERYTQAELRGMLLHELAHLRRRDGLWIWLGLAVCALHWFNPLVWLCLRRYLADRELECDRAALNLLPEPDRITYGHALLKTLAGNRAWSFATCTPFSRPQPNHELKHRITMIAQPLNSTWGRFAALLTVPVLALGTLTTAADEEGKKPAREEGRREGDGEGARKTGPRDGEGTRTGPRDGEARKEGARDGEVKRTGPRDGEGERKTGPRDGEVKREGARDGEGSRTGPREGDGVKKEGARDGDGMKREGVRDGDGAKRGPREGDGEGRRSAEAEGGARRSAEGEGGARMSEGEGRAPKTAAAVMGGQQMVITVNAEGNVVNSAGEVIEINRVRGKMKDIAEQNPGQSVILRAAADTPYAKVMNVVDALKDSGLKNVQLEQAQ